MNGFRQPAQASRKQKVQGIEAELKNTQMALRINQMLLQQMMQSNKALSEDMGRALGLINEMQYKMLAIQNVAKLDVTELNTIANDLRLKDFNEASDKEDAEKGNTVATVVDKDSIIIVTSTTGESDKGIFRSKISLADQGLPKDIVEGFLGREVGAKVVTTLNGVEHTIELLGIRQPAPAAEAPTLQAVEAEATEEQAQ